MTTTFFFFLGFIILLLGGGYTVTRKYDYTPKNALMKKSSDLNALPTLPFPSKLKLLFLLPNTLYRFMQITNTPRSLCPLS